LAMANQIVGETAAKEALAVPEYKRGLTLRVLALGIAILLAGFYVNTRMWWNKGITTQPLLPGLSLSFLLMLLALALPRLKFTPQEFVAFMALAPIGYIGFMSWAIEPLTLPYWAQTEPNLAELMKYVPSIWAPSDPKLVEGMIKGGASIPAGILGPLLLQCIILFSLMLMVIFTAAIYVRRFVEVERLAFPAVIPSIVVLRSYEEGTLFSKQNWPFYVGFAAGIAIAIYSTLVYFIPGFPVFFAWGQFYWTDWEKFWKSLNPSIAEWWMFVPSLNMLFFIMPLDVAASICIWTFIKSIVLPFIAVGAGWIAPGQPVAAGPFDPTFFSFASIIAFGLWALVFGWKTLYAGFRSVWAKGEVIGGTLAERLLWIGLLGSWVLYFLLFLALGANPGLLLLFLIITFLGFAGHTRLVAETGSWYGAYYLDIPRILTHNLAYTFAPNPWPSRSWWATLAAMRFRDEVSQGGGYTPASAIGIWKLAYETRTDYRDVLIAQLIFAFLYAFVGLIMGTALLYAFGAETVYSKIWYVYGRRRYGIMLANEVPGLITPGPTYGPKELTHIVGALLVVGVLWFLRAKFAWFFFTPVALAFYSGYWFINSLIPVIAKFLIIRFAGMRAYEKYALPIAVGYMVGTGFGAFVMLTAYALTP